MNNVPAGAESRLATAQTAKAVAAKIVRVTRASMFTPIYRIRHKFLVGDSPPISRTANSFFCDVGQYRNPSYGTPLDNRPDGKLIVFGFPKSGNATRL
jgi:hypothetical protein